MKPNQIQHFYIPEDQSIYLLASQDAQKIKNWLHLCERELQRLGYRDIELIGKGAYGFAFAGIDSLGHALVFKFTRIDLPQSIHDRLAEEAYMLSQVSHPNVPKCIAFEQVNKQSILVMERAPGIDLEQYSIRYGRISPKMAVSIMLQLLDILTHLHQTTDARQAIIHGDIKPSNLIWEESTQRLSLIDWGSSVFAQTNLHGELTTNNVLSVMSDDPQTSNARLGDIYFIGDEQLNGALSSPSFDYQGLASTVYALSSAQGARFGYQVITPNSLGLPKMCADLLNALFDTASEQRLAGALYLQNNIYYLQNTVFREYALEAHIPLIPCYIEDSQREIESVVYSSRKSFLREQDTDIDLSGIANDAQFARYYKHYLQGMGNTEKAFLAAVSRLAKYPVVGGLAIRWQANEIFVDSHLTLHCPSLLTAFEQTLNNMITLARAIHREGVFKACLFDAKDTLHISRNVSGVFAKQANHQIPFDLKSLKEVDKSSQHSYFEDGDDPDEQLILPEIMRETIEKMNNIHHAGCIIFEVHQEHLKIHTNLTLFESEKAPLFTSYLERLLQSISFIDDVGISGFMKLPYKDTRRFTQQARIPDAFYPRNIKTI